MTDIILPEDNRQNVEEDLTPEQLQGLNMHYVKTIEELLAIATSGISETPVPAAPETLFPRRDPTRAA